MKRLTLFLHFLGAFCIGMSTARAEVYQSCYSPTEEAGPQICASIVVPPSCVPPNQDFTVTVSGAINREPPYPGEITAFWFYENADWVYKFFDYNEKRVQLSSGTWIDDERFHWGANHTGSYTFNKPVGTYKFSFIYGYRTDPHEWYDVAVDAYVSVGTGVAQTIRIPIDIHPNGCPNPLSTEKEGVLPVAIIGTQEFDVRTVDVNSILLKGVAPLDYSYSDVTRPDGYTSKTDRKHCTEEAGDGREDLVVHFDQQAVIAALEEEKHRLLIDDEILLLSLTATVAGSSCTTLYGEDIVFVVSQNIDFDGDGFTSEGGDCNDRSVFVYPGASEMCDGVDNNCDGIIDEGLLITLYRDKDGDGFGDPDSPVQSCRARPGYSANNSDCNDRVYAIKPGAQEVCDGLDNNCNGTVDENNPGGGIACSTGMPGVCATGATMCANGGIICSQTVFPSTETCDGKDNDCDGLLDEGVSMIYCRDADGDTYGDPYVTIAIESCVPPAGYVMDVNDCNDANLQVNPGMTEVTGNGIDENCNGLIDESGQLVGLISNGGTYDSVQPAYDAAGNNDRILMRATAFSGALNLNRDVTVALTGGYDSSFTSRPGVTTLSAPTNPICVISNGKVIADRIILR